MDTATCRRCRGETYRVLVVDDHPRARDMLSTLIRWDDQRLDVYSVCEAVSGEEAVARARAYKPHVILMDINLPGMDGFEAARRIREDLPLVHVVMVTAVGERSQRQEAARLGAAGFLTKDQVGTDLVPMLSRVLDSIGVGRINVSEDFGSSRQL